MTDVFLSYASEDRERAQRLADALEARGLVTAVIISVGMIKTTLVRDTPSESTCNSLRGDYELYSPYIYIGPPDTPDLRAMTSKSSLITANECDSEDEEGSVVLKGNEITIHEISVKINGEYQSVAEATTEYPSEITIDKNGVLSSREVKYPLKDLG